YSPSGRHCALRQRGRRKSRRRGLSLFLEACFKNPLCIRARLQSCRKREKRTRALAPAASVLNHFALAAAKAETSMGTAIGTTEVVPCYKAKFPASSASTIDPPELD